MDRTDYFMVKIIDNGEVKSLYDYPHKFIKTVAKMDNEFKKQGLELDEIVITGKEVDEINWSCDLRLLGL